MHPEGCFVFVGQEAASCPHDPCMRNGLYLMRNLPVLFKFTR